MIAGKTYPVRFTLKAVKTYERLSGRPLLQENYMKIINLTLGVDCLTAFVYAAIESGCTQGQQPDLKVEDLELQLGFDFSVYNDLVQAYIDFIPGMRALYERSIKDVDFAKKVADAAGDEVKLEALYNEFLGSPNGTIQAATA